MSTARNLAWSGTVALKVLAPELSQDDSFRERFRASPVAASLDHPNVIPIYEAGDRTALSTSRCATWMGTTCKASCERRGRCRRPGRSILSQVAARWTPRTATGLVHRDVKPANLLVVARPRHEGADHVYLPTSGSRSTRRRCADEDRHVRGHRRLRVAGADRRARARPRADCTRSAASCTRRLPARRRTRRIRSRPHVRAPARASAVRDAEAARSASRSGRRHRQGDGEERGRPLCHHAGVRRGDAQGVDRHRDPPDPAVRPGSSRPGDRDFSSSRCRRNSAAPAAPSAGRGTAVCGPRGARACRRRAEAEEVAPPVAIVLLVLIAGESWAGSSPSPAEARARRRRAHSSRWSSPARSQAHAPHRTLRRGTQSRPTSARPRRTLSQPSPTT